MSGSIPYTFKNVVMLGGGFVTGVIFSPVEKDLIYARTDIGGAYRYNPADGTWLPLTDHLGRAQENYKGIESLAADPVDPNRVYMAVGTYTQEWAGTGAMMRSSDRGQTWELNELSIKMGGNENGRGNGERLAVDPNDNKIILFGSRKYGLWTSSDQGKTWSQGSFPVKEEPLGVGITFVLFDKASGTQGKPTPTVYAGWASKKGGLYRSKDGAKTWELVPGQPKGVMPSHAGFDSEGTLYLSYGDHPGPSDVTTGSVWKYVPKTNQWANVTPIKPTGDDKFGYGGLSVSPSQVGMVMVTTLDRWTKGDVMMRTVDGGKTWSNLREKGEFNDAGAKYLYWGREQNKAGLSMSGWMADIDIDPFNPSRAMYVTGQGIWGTEDAAQADKGEAVHWKFMNEGLEETVGMDFVSPPSGPPLLSMLADVCGFRHDDLDKPPSRGMFVNPIFGNGRSIDFAQNKPDVVVRSGSQDKKQFGAISMDAGVTWTPFPALPQGVNGGGTIAISADALTVFWIPKGAPPSYSRDQGKTWIVAQGVPEVATVPDWAPVPTRVAADRVNPEKVYIYDAMGGKALTSKDGGATFEVTDPALPSLPDWGLTPAAIETVPGVEGQVWITTGKDLYRSKDSGATYQALDEVQESYGIGFGKPAEGKTAPTIYLSAKIGDVDGIFRSDDSGASFVRINDDLHQYGGTTLIGGDPRVYGRVYFGTHGRGILYGEPK